MANRNSGVLGDQFLGVVLGVVAIAYVGFHIANLFVSFGPIGAKVIHICAGSAVLALDLARRSPGRGMKILCAVIFLTVLPAALYFLSDQVGILTRYGFGSTADIAAGAVIVFWMFVLTALYFGPAFAIIGILFFVYAYLGSYMPAPFTAPAVDGLRVTSKLTVGAMGDIVELSVTVIFVVLVFGALLQASGAGEFIWRVAGAVSRRLGGGTGAIAVCSSGLVATFTGIGAATTAITAPIAIPIMKRDGYTSEQAAAIEAIASTGGQITPPILGLAAFLMADFLGVPYSTIVIAAILPALLFYVGLLAYVTLEYRKRAARGRTKPAETAERASMDLFRAGIGFIVPMAILIVLIMNGVSVQTAVLGAILGILVLAVGLRIERSPKVWMRGLVEAAVTGASIGMAAGVLDVVMTSLDITQLGMLAGFVVSELAGDSRLGTLVILIVAAYIMGMGMPGIAVYTVLAVTLVPALTSIGVAPIVAHFLIMYMIIMSNFTPPVAPTLVITAKIAGARYMSAGWEAIKAGAGAMFLPFLIFLYPELLLQNPSLASASEALGVSLLAIFLLTVSLCGWFGRSLSPVERLVLAAGPLLVWGARYEGASSLYWTFLVATFALGSWLVLLAWRNGAINKVAARG